MIVKVEIWIRNLTRDFDKQLFLPMSETELAKVIQPDDEYIIVDDVWLNTGEYYSIAKLNEDLSVCEEDYNIDEETLKVILRIACDFDNAMEIVRDESFVIVDFNAVTSGWNNGHGGNVCNDDDKGLALFSEGYYNPFDFEYNEDMENWIRWDGVWTSAETEGWQAISTQNGDYLVHR